MMKARFYLLAACLILSFYHRAQSCKDGVDLIKYMHKKYYKAPCSCYTFSQKNSHYKKDTISAVSEWHEEIRFPDYFKIVFGDADKGNYVVFKNDSVYNYKEGKFMRSRSDSSSLLLILGGMYYRPLPEVMARLRAAGYDLKKLDSRTWFKKDVWVLGAASVEDPGNQIWITKGDFRVVRILEKLNGDDMMDMRFEQHEKWCKGWIETQVSFRRNGELEQVEEYYDIKECLVK